MACRATRKRFHNCCTNENGREQQAFAAEKEAANVDQCAISTGTVIDSNTVRETPPSRISRKREWP